MRLIVFLLGMALEASAAAPYKLLSECDQPSGARAVLAKDTPITVHYAIAGATTCYAVTAIVDGKQVRGYVVDSELDGIIAFEKARIKSRQELGAQPILPPAPEQTPDPAGNATEPKKSADSTEPVKEVPESKAKPAIQPH
jgi:hypothetical protein